MGTVQYIILLTRVLSFPRTSQAVVPTHLPNDSPDGARLCMPSPAASDALAFESLRSGDGVMGAKSSIAPASSGYLMKEHIKRVRVLVRANGVLDWKLVFCQNTKISQVLIPPLRGLRVGAMTLSWRRDQGSERL